ncbi:MAG: hypothetical protein JXB15_03365, partial [Anaerolineales bacterium]|nr:hypothetical protein [Anaerolineales bacterium]
AERENLQTPSNSPRVLRGGSFGNLAWDARCAYRLRFSPDDWYFFRGFGFRVVVRPRPPGL